MTLKKTQAVVVAAWIAVLSAPWVQGAFNIADVRPVRQNRIIRKCMPEFSWTRLLQIDTPLAREYDAFFNDRHPLRDLLIRCKNQLEFSWFEHSDKLILGPGHAMFYRDNMEQKQTYIERSWPGYGQQTVDGLSQLAARLQLQGVDLLVAVIPQKHSIYPEWLSVSAPRLPKSTALDAYSKKLAAAGLLAIDVKAVLLKARQEMDVPLYHRTDFHWNGVGADIVSRALGQALQNRYGTKKQVSPALAIETIEVMDGWTGVGQLQSLAVFAPPAERLHRVPQASPTKSDHLPSAFPFEHGYQSSERQRLPPTVLFGDSFADIWRQMDFPLQFSQLRWADHEQMRKLISRVPAGTRLVLLVHAEIHLQTMMSDVLDRDRWWPEPAAGAP